MNYIYVVALSDDRNENPNMLSFKHIFVEANNEYDAYSKGFDTLKITNHETRWNDYTINVTDIATHFHLK